MEEPRRIRTQPKLPKGHHLVAPHSNVRGGDVAQHPFFEVIQRSALLPYTHAQQNVAGYVGAVKKKSLKKYIFFFRGPPV